MIAPRLIASALTRRDSASLIGFQSVRSLAGVKDRAIKAVKPGATIVVEGTPYRVGDITQGKRGKGGGFVRARLKNMIAGGTQEKTFTSDEMVEQADLTYEAVTFSWLDSNQYVFMNSSTFEEIRISSELIESYEFIEEGIDVKIMRFNGEPMGAELPLVIESTVTSIDMSISRADSKRGDLYQATLSSGAKIMVPNFVKEGTRIKVSTVEKAYVERV